MEAVILDGYTINPGDLTWKRLELICDKVTVLTILPLTALPPESERAMS